MKLFITSFIFLLLIAFPMDSYSAVFHPKAPAQIENPITQEDVVIGEQKSNRAIRKANREQRRSFRKDLVAQFKDLKKSGGGADSELILYIILGLLIPPLAMFLYDGEASGRFWISLGLALLAIPLWGSLGALAALASVVYTLYIIISESI